METESVIPLQEEKLTLYVTLAPDEYLKFPIAGGVVEGKMMELVVLPPTVEDADPPKVPAFEQLPMLDSVPTNCPRTTGILPPLVCLAIDPSESIVKLTLFAYVVGIPDSVALSSIDTVGSSIVASTIWKSNVY